MLAEQLERLYVVFSGYSRPRRLEGCPCCTSTAEAALLLRKPLRALTVPELEHYAFKALTTWGTLDDYKYFIPRIIELSQSRSLLCDIEVTLHKFDYGDFHDGQQANKKRFATMFSARGKRQLNLPILIEPTLFYVGPRHY
jgi:hypothetical protein